MSATTAISARDGRNGTKSPGRQPPRRPRPTTFTTAAAALGAAGLALRVLTLVGYWPGNISHPDSASYVDAAAHSLFSNPFRPAGYSVLLRLLHGVTSAL